MADVAKWKDNVPGRYLSMNLVFLTPPILSRNSYDAEMGNADKAA